MEFVARFFARFHEISIDVFKLSWNRNLLSCNFANFSWKTLQIYYLFRLFKPKNDYTDVDFNFEIPVPNIKIPYPIYKVGYQNLFPWKTWITLDPVKIFNYIWKILKEVLEFVGRIGIVVGNTIDIFKLGAAFSLLQKTQHIGWAGGAEDYSDNSWRFLDKKLL